MDKRYQVFVSSTFEDLQEERKEVMQALLELDCIPAGMELFPASNEDQWTLIKRVIDDCDYYLLIIGGRYGSTNDEGKSYTQMEFEYALEQGKPIISFLPKQPENIPTGKSEKDEAKREKLENFKKLAQKKMIKFWTTPSDLGSVVSRSMIQLIKNFPSEGWVKAGSAVDEKSLQEIAKLQRENEELKKRLDVIDTEPPTGTENFSQGDDVIELKYTFSGETIGNYDIRDYSGSLSLTWNEIFKSIAPSLITSCNTVTIKERLEEHIESSYEWSNGYNYPPFESADSFEITNDTFDVVLIQFRALGLIRLVSNEKTALQKALWKLTPYGDYMMTQLLAIKKEK